MNRSYSSDDGVDQLRCILAGSFLIIYPITVVHDIMVGLMY